MNFRHKKLLLLFLSIATVIIDRLAKLYMDKTLEYGSTATVIPNILSATKVYNTGAAFSFLEGQVHFLTFLSVAAIAGIIYFILFKTKTVSLYSAVSWGLILGGTTGNFIDRLFLHYVIDFIRLDFVDFPIFNLADMAINIGAIMILAGMFLDKSKEKGTVE